MSVQPPPDGDAPRNDPAERADDAAPPGADDAAPRGVDDAAPRGADAAGREAALLRVEHLRTLRRYADAERAAREALAAEPQDAALLTALSATLLGSGRHADGLAAADAALAVAPDSERAHRMRALHLSQLGRHPEAQQAGYASVTLAPDDAAAAVGYAVVLQRAGRLRDAEQVARRGVALAPHSADAHLVLADIASDLGDRAARERARAAYAETLRLDPQNAAARHDLALLDARTHRPARALGGLVDAGRLDPTLPVVLRTVTAVLWQLSWRLRIWFVVAAVGVLGASGDELTAPGPGPRIAAAVVLVVTGALGWWTVRDLPARTWPVARAALRTDRPLMLTAVALVACLLLFVVVVVTGFAAAVAAVWLVLVVLGWLALVVRLRRRSRRP